MSLRYPERAEGGSATEPTLCHDVLLINVTSRRHHGGGSLGPRFQSVAISGDILETPDIAECRKG